jgi:Histidine kinase
MNHSLPDTQEDTSKTYWRWQFGGWGMLFLCRFLAEWRILSWPPLNAIVNEACLALFFLSATHFLRVYSKRKQWIQLIPRALVARVFLGGILLALAITFAQVGLDVLLQEFEFDLRRPARVSLGLWMLTSFANALGLLWLWMSGYFGVVLMRQRQHVAAEDARLRAALRTAELGLLKSQLNPHFLFNALNTVRALIVESPERAQLAVTQLARTLRYSLNSARDEIVELKTELEIVDDYLGIETLRLAERLTIVMEIASDTLQSRIPIMLLQTLVENAVKHGISQLPQGGVLRIAAHMDTNVLIIEVNNDRPLIKSGSIPSDRVGLANASERLRLMVGPSASLALDLSQAQRARATVRIPQSEPVRT